MEYWSSGVVIGSWWSVIGMLVIGYR